MKTLIQQDYNILLLTSQRYKALEIQSSSIYFDLDDSVSSGLLKIKKIDDSFNDFEDITNLISEIKPAFVIIDEISDRKLNSIHHRLIEFLESLEESDITSFFIASVSKDDYSKNLIRKLASNTTAIIHLQKSLNKRDYSGIVTLKPNIGYFEGEFETSYKIEPIKGFITLSDNERKIIEMFSRVSENDNGKAKHFNYSNLYEFEEFEFLIESKVALAEKTGKKIYIIKYQMINDVINVDKLCSLFLEKLELSDKICCYNNEIYILPDESTDISPKKIIHELDEEIKKLIDQPHDVDKYFVKNVHILNNNFKLIEQ